MDRYPDKLWLETPLIRSTHISSLLGVDAYLKLEVGFSKIPAQWVRSMNAPTFTLPLVQ